MNKKGKTSKPFTRLERETAVRLVRDKYHNSIGDDCLDEIERTLDNGRRPTRQAVDKWNKALTATNAVSQSVAIFDADGTHATADAPQIVSPAVPEPGSEGDKLKAISHEMLDRIWRKLRKGEMPSPAEFVAMGISLDKLAKWLSVPDEILDNLAPLGRLAALVQRLRDAGELADAVTLGSIIDSYADALESRAARIEAGEAIAGDERAYERSAEYSDLSIPELVAELDAVVTHDDWLTIQAYEARRFASLERGNVLGMLYRPRSADDAWPELLALCEEEQARIGVSRPADVRSLIRQLREQRAAQSNELPGSPTAPAPKPAPQAVDEAPDEAVIVLQTEPPAELADGDRKEIQEAQKATEMIAYFKSQRGALGTAWDLMKDTEKRMYERKAGIIESTTPR